jgi:hypothetical protein
LKTPSPQPGAEPGRDEKFVAAENKDPARLAPKIASRDQTFLRNDMGHLALPIQTLSQLEIMQ